eukprot:13796434-Ditylum_brightwellii.AAC.1
MGTYVRIYEYGDLGDLLTGGCAEWTTKTFGKSLTAARKRCLSRQDIQQWEKNKLAKRNNTNIYSAYEEADPLNSMDFE